MVTYVDVTQNTHECSGLLFCTCDYLQFIRSEILQQVVAQIRCMQITVQNRIFVTGFYLDWIPVFNRRMQNI